MQDFLLVVQWIRPPANTGDMGSTLVWEDSTYLGATTCAPQPLSLCSRVSKLQLLKPVCLQLHNKRSHRKEKPSHPTRENPHSPQHTREIK